MVRFIGTRTCLTSQDHAGPKELQTRRKYDADFKAEVLKMLASGQTPGYIANALGISENIIYRWKNKNQVGKKRPATSQ